MTQGEELGKIIARTLAEIMKSEREKAIKFGNYEDAIVAGFLEGIFREAESSFQTVPPTA